MLSSLSKFGQDASYSYSSSSSSLGASFLIGYGIFLVVLYLITSFFLSRVFRKAGRSPGAAYVPFYNSWVQLEIGGEKGVNIFWVLLPFVGGIIFLVFHIKSMLELGRRFGKSTVFSVFGLIVFSFIGTIILAVDKSVYNDPANPNTTGPTGPAEPAYPQFGTQTNVVPGPVSSAPVPPAGPDPVSPTQATAFAPQPLAIPQQDITPLQQSITPTNTGQ